MIKPGSMVLLWWKSSGSGCCCCLEVVREENLSVNAERLGIVLRKGLNDIASRNSLISLVRGKGLLNAIVIDCDEESDLAWQICLRFRDYGLLNQLTVIKLDLLHH
jgi:ornithine--oxo-acid transaminase